MVPAVIRRVLLIRWRVSLMVTVLHCNWGNSALCNLRPERRTHHKSIMKGQEGGGQWGGHVRRTRKEKNPQNVQGGKEVHKVGGVNVLRWHRDNRGDGANIKWLNKGRARTYETTNHVRTGNGTTAEQKRQRQLGWVTNKMTEWCVMAFWGQLFPWSNLASCYHSSASACYFPIYGQWSRHHSSQHQCQQIIL